MIKKAIKQAVSLVKNGLKSWIYSPVHEGWQGTATEGFMDIYK
jgi:hypothetical protein